MILGPFRLSTGTEMKVAFFRRDDTEIALREAGETGIAITLTEALFGSPAAVYTADLIEILDGELLSQLGIQIQHLLTQAQLIGNR